MKTPKCNLLVLCLFLIFSNQSVSQSNFWGLMPYGGSNTQGAIFKTSDEGASIDAFHHFEKDVYGIRPEGGLFQASNGKLYGMTGGASNCGGGMLFEYDPITQIYIEKHKFEGSDGKRPRGHLMEASDGYLYGLTYLGGANVGGVIFRYDMATSVYTKLYDFDPIQGANPTGSLVQAANGKLYGLTFYGGPYNEGVLFEFDPVDLTYTLKVDFDSDKGYFPYGSLFVASNGFLYGTTNRGGKNEKGVLFEYQPDQDIYTVMTDFGNMMGSYPKGSLIETSNGKLYGMTTEQGLNGYGTLFEYDYLTNVLSKKFDFDLTGYGLNPDGRLTLGPSGLLYGLLNKGGANGFGVLFSYNTQASNYSTKLDLDNNLDLAVSNLTFVSNDLLYGVTTEGGDFNQGVLFEYEITSNTYTSKVFFGNVKEGRRPIGSLTEAANGKIYGTTNLGGICDRGVLLEIDPTTNVVERVENLSSIAGKNPVGKLLQANDGLFYGLTADGGSEDRGILYSYDPDAGFESLHYFIDDEFVQDQGDSPKGSLIQAGNGRLYGTTSEGGDNGFGVLFEFELTFGSYTVLHHFLGTDGAKPEGALLQLTNGLLYGLASEGGANDKGVVFSYDLVNSSYSVLASFDGLNGAHPKGELIKKNGQLWGLTAEGGDTNTGAIFSFDPTTNSLLKKSSFDQTTGFFPQGSLMLSENGSFYGLCEEGGSQNQGTLFEYNPITNSLVKKSNFTSNTGHNPVGNLLEIGGCLQANAPNLSVEVTPQMSGVLGAINLTITDGNAPFSIDWDIDGIGDNDDNEDLTDLEEGIYLAIITDANGCQTPLQVEVDRIIPISELEGLTVDLYPNPVQNTLRVSLNNFIPDLSYTVSDAYGRSLMVDYLRENMELDLSGLATGIYFLRLEHQDKTLVYKFVKD